MTLEQISNTLCIASVALCLFDSVRLRRRLKRYEAERAEAVARALGDGMVMVDEYTLPSPTDLRWETTIVEMEGGSKKTMIALGSVRVTAANNENLVYVIGKIGAPPLTPTVALERYAKQVKTSYYNNTVRKSLERES